MSKYKYPITIFTPTYNRAYIIERLYESLKRQTFKDFEWIIYDDGSKDNTQEVVSKFISESDLEINFVQSVNRGKHVAINEGTEIAQGKLFFIVDSDDYLTDDSLEEIIRVWNTIENKSEFAGVGGRKMVNNQSRSFTFDGEFCDKNSCEFSLIDKNMQDKSEVYVTDVLKEYKFKVFEGENFMTEAVVWYAIASDGYKIRWFNKDIYIAEYLEDGLSNNFYKRRIENINSTCYSYNKLSSFNIPFKYKLRYKINYYRYGLTKFSKRELDSNLRDKSFKYIAYLMGSMLFKKDSNRS